MTEQVVGDPEATELQEETSNGDRCKLGKLEKHIGAAMFSKSPVPVAVPAENGRNGDGNDFCAERALEEMTGAEDAQPQHVEDTHVDDVAEQTDDAELQRIGDEFRVHQAA